MVMLARSPFARVRWLVLAPHADDETLGAGALIVEAARRGRLAGVAYLTDGAGSHPHYDRADAGRLVRTRRGEARRALARLTDGMTPPPLFLGWPDARPHSDTTPAFATTRDRLVSLCIARRVDAIAVTAGHEAHCDHAAAFALARAVRAATPRAIALFEYCVWSDPPSRRRTIETRAVPTGLRRHALHAHRSQLTAAFGPGFRLPRAKLRMPARDRLYLWEKPGAA